MTQEKDVENMPIWQNHEQRITALEVTQANMKHEFKEVKEAINKGNQSQLKKLDEINNRLFEEFFHKKRITHKEKWKLFGSIVGYLLGGGSILYFILEKLF